MKRDKELIISSKRSHGSVSGPLTGESLQEKTGATAEQIRKAIEIVGFDRAKVEQYLAQFLGNNNQFIQSFG